MMCLHIRRRFFFVFCLALASVYHGVAAVGKSKARLMVPQQRIEGSRQDDGSWKLSINVSDPRLQCAKETITATFEVITDGTVSETRGITTSIPHKNRIHLYESQNLIDVALDPWKALENKCNPQMNAVMTIAIACPHCYSVESVVKFSYGKPLAEITAVFQKRYPCFILDDIPAYRFFSLIPDDLLVYRGGTTVSAVADFRPQKGGSQIESFYVRPRGPMIRGWYVEDLGAEGRRVFITIQLPETWSERYIPRILIEVVCGNCKRFSLRYEPARPKWRTIEATAAHKRFLNQNLTSTKVRSAQLPLPTATAWHFETNTEALCSSAFDGAMYFRVYPITAQPKFSFNMDGVTYGTSAIQDGSAWLVRWLPENAADFCSREPTKVTLSTVCTKCNVREEGDVARLPQEPELTDGTALTADLKFTSSWKTTKTCDINFQVEAFQEVYPSFRLWFDKEIECSSPKNPSFNWREKRDLLHSWERRVKDALRQKNGSVNNDTGDRSVSLSGGSECLCQHLKMRGYHLLDLDFYDDTKEPQNVLIQTVGKPLPFELTFHGFYFVKYGEYRIFKNFLSSEDVKSITPFVATFCFDSNSEIESAFLGDYKIMELNTAGYKNRCFAFDSCDIWRVLAQHHDMTFDLPSIKVTGRWVPQFLFWRVDKATELKQNMKTGDGLNARVGGWYGTALEGSITSIDTLMKFKIEKSPALHCTPLSSDSVPEKLRGNKVTESDESSSSMVFVRPSFQLQPSAPRLGVNKSNTPHTSDWDNVKINAFTSSLLLALVVYFM